MAAERAGPDQLALCSMIILMNAFSAAEAPAAPSLRDRDQIPERFKWNLSNIFSDWDAWRAASGRWR